MSASCYGGALRQLRTKGGSALRTKGGSALRAASALRRLCTKGGLGTKGGSALMAWFGTKATPH